MKRSRVVFTHHRIMNATQVMETWDAAVADLNIQRILTLYAPDCELESPLVFHLTEGRTGILRGHAELERFIRMVAERQPAGRRHHRGKCFTDGTRIMWEYPRETPEGDQIDLAEVMDLTEDGLIRRHRVYWGWSGMQILLTDAYHR